MGILQRLLKENRNYMALCSKYKLKERKKKNIFLLQFNEKITIRKIVYMYKT